MLLKHTFLNLLPLLLLPLSFLVTPASATNAVGQVQHINFRAAATPHKEKSVTGWKPRAAATPHEEKSVTGWKPRAAATPTTFATHPIEIKAPHEEKSETGWKARAVATPHEEKSVNPWKARQTLG
ncbi:hypothetical protein K491DRAFT_675637 [Lophiostoma macrostomum CBS 122681]|uniref:Uncharacterized protein n=1 Tax=Lophiostoma macrostomum CBS 122681 TaxID=1314788 RepID=A0A6A6TJ22_9PLEO|nr:hypothetical protein K491DRAFT_675637 [Lophiostoma macrostomum CBS 122681]